jgi:hypothetical protein
MDYSQVDVFIDTRESNFLSNPKSWVSDESSEDLPFETVATTALMLDGQSKNVTIYNKISDRSLDVSLKAWQIDSIPEHHLMDAFIATLLSTNETTSAELLLVNLDLVLKDNFVSRLEKRWKLARNGKLEDLGYMEREAFEIYSLLGWCWIEGKRHTVSKTSASHSCYAKGQRST